MKKSYKNQADRAEAFQVWNAFKDEVRERGMEILPEIVAKFGQTTLKKTAPGMFMACCPFHSEKTPSFQVSSKGYYCHGAACGAKGDVFTFLQDKCGMSFKDAVMEVANEVGILPPEDMKPSAPYRPGRPVERAPVDPADEFLAETSRLGAHDLRVVPPALWVPRPGKFARLFREGKEDENGQKTEGAVKTYKPEMVHQYRDVDNNLRMVILRLKFRDGKKIFFPLRAEPPLEGTPAELVKDGVAWHVRNTGNESRRPVYGAHNLRAWIADPNRGPILLVEGEKCADYTERLFPEPGTLVLSASGGFNATMLADWKEMTDVMAAENVVPERIIVWPDAEPNREFRDGTTRNTQEYYAKQVFSGLLRDLWESFGYEEIRQRIEFLRAIPPEGVEKGWDLADAVDEGWTREKVEAYMSEAVPVDLSHMDGHAPKMQAKDEEAEPESPSLGN